MSHGTTAFARVRVRALALSLTALTILLLACAGDASAAFKPTGFSATPTNMQAGGHGNLAVTAALDAASGEQTNDDLRELRIDLPTGQMFNPRAVSATCSDAQFKSDSCPAASLVGGVSVRYRLLGSTKTATGSVYVLPSTGDSPLNFAFVVRPSGLAKWFFQSSKVSGMTTVRPDYGLSVTIPQIPYAVKDAIGLQYPITLAEIGLTFNAQAPSGKYFVFNTTRCDAAKTLAQFTSTRNQVVTLSATWVPTGCVNEPFDPNLVVSPTVTTVGAPTGINATLTVNTDDAAIQRAHLRDITVALPGGSTINLDVLNATAVCSEAQLTADACPAASRVGDAVVDVPFLPAKMTGGIFLIGTDTVKFGVVINGPSGTQAIFRGTAKPASIDGVARIVASFSGLPEAPYTSAQLNFTSKLVNNPEKGCPNAWSKVDSTGYNGSATSKLSLYPLSGCIPDTIVTQGFTSPTKNTRPSVSFTSDLPGATFKCRVDVAGAWNDCSSPFQAPTALAEGEHRYYIRAFYGGIGDPTPVLIPFTVDTTPPTLDWTAPAANSTVYGDTVKFEWSTEAGATSKCAFLPDVTLEDCAPGRTYTNVGEGEHTAFVSVKDAAGNVKSVFRTITVVPNVDPVITITAPTPGQQLILDRVKVEYTATSPVGSDVWQKSCEVQAKSGANWYQIDGEYTCDSGTEFRDLPPNSPLRLKIEAVDDEMRESVKYVEFVSGQRDPYSVSIDDGPNGTPTNDRTPTFQLGFFNDALYPAAEHYCDIVRPTQTTRNWQRCEGATYTSPTSLADGDWKIVTKSVSGSRTSFENSQSFGIAPWATTYTAAVTSSAAGAHPDLDVEINVPSGQLRKVDMLLPRGLIGSLNSFDQCPANVIANPRNCPASTKIGNVETLIVLQGLNLAKLPGSVYLTAPQAPGDVAGIVIIVPKPVSNYGDVVIPMRLQLTQNATVMRVFSDSIPVEVARTDDGDFYDYYVKWFKLHLNGSQGSPFPLLTNPSSCAADQFSTVLGAFDGEQTAALPVAFQATNCAALTFAPTITQSLSNNNAGQLTGLTTEVNLPAGSSSMKTIRVNEPPALSPSLASFGAVADQCPAGSATSSSFDATDCPAASKVGSMTIDSPVLKEPLTGTVHLINRSPLPWLGIKLDQTGISVRLVGVTSLPQVDAGCDPLFDTCPTRISVAFGSLPDLPYSKITMVLDGPPRTTAAGGTLSGQILSVATASDPACTASSPMATTFTATSGAANVIRSQSFAINGCAG